MDSIEWRKSSKSGNNGACVEVAQLDENTIGVRDSKDGRGGPVLCFDRAQWSAFLRRVVNGEFRP